MLQDRDYISYLLGGLAALAVNRGGRLTKLRLVKFLYLFDLYWAQAEKRTYTNWPWAFIHYGPYCRESTDAIDVAVQSGFLAAQSYESRFSDEDFRLYGPGGRMAALEIDEFMSSMPIHVSARLTSAVKRWYDDSYGLLDYVYFRTGPMKHARPGEVLSFANEEIPDMDAVRPVKMLPLSNKKKSALREAIQKIGKEIAVHNQPPELFDKEYFDFVSGLAGPETEAGISGTAKLDFDGPSDD